MSQWYPLSQPDKNLPPLPPPTPPPTHGTLIKKVKASLASTTSNFGTLTKKGKRGDKNLGTHPLLSQSLQEMTRTGSLSNVLEPLKDNNNKRSAVKLSLQEVTVRRRRSRRDCNNSRLSVFELSSGQLEEEDETNMEGATLGRVPSTPNLAPGAESPSTMTQRNLSLFEFLDGLNTPRTKARIFKFTQELDAKRSRSQQELLRPPTSRPTSSASSISSSFLSYTSLRYSHSSSNVHDDQASSSASESSSLSSYGLTSSNGGRGNNNNSNRLSLPHHMRGWSEDDADKTKPSSLTLQDSHPSGGRSPVIRHYSFMDSLEDIGGDSPTEPRLSLGVTKASTPLKAKDTKKFTSDDGYDHLLPFVRINDDAPHRPHSLCGSTETLTPHSPDTPIGRSRSWGEQNTLSANSGHGLSKGGVRLSRSMNELSFLSGQDREDREDLSQSSLDFSDCIRTPLSQDSSLSSDSYYSSGLGLERCGQPRLESILERSIEASASYQIKTSSPSSSPGSRLIKKSVSMEVLSELNDSHKTK